MTSAAGPRGCPRWSDTRTVRVVARLAQGAVLDERWPATLDGIVASQARRDRLGDCHGSDPDHHTDRLPFCRVTEGTGKQWWWAASGAEPIGIAERDVHWVHKRVKHAAADQCTGAHLPPTIYDSMSRWRAYRLPVVATACAALGWWAVGHPDEIAAAVDRVCSVGGKWATGEGRVVTWEVTDCGHADLARVVWSDDGTISRPVPARCAATVGAAPDCDTVQAAVRPPYWRPPPVTEGSFARAWREVIAPWTTQIGCCWTPPATLAVEA